MKFFVAVFAALAATALADKAKPSPVFNAADKKATGLEKKAPVTADKRSDAPAADEYGSPAAPAQDQYGSPEAPPVQDEYGSPQAAPVTQAPGAGAAGSVGTQGFYYYYYPVASSYGGSSGGHGGGGHAAAKPAADGALGGLSPIVLILGGLGLLVLLGLLAAAVSGGLGRSFGDGFSLLPNDYLSSFDMDSLTETVYRAVREYQGVEFA